MKKVIIKLELALHQPERFRMDPFEDPRRYSHPYWISGYLLTSGWRVGLFCNKSKDFLQRWLLSRVLHFGPRGQEEGIMRTFILGGHQRLARPYQLVTNLVTNRKMAGEVLTAYQVCRELKPLTFPRLPDVRNPEGNPSFEVLSNLVQRKPSLPKK
jgi:hypothetical protein